MRRAHHCLLDLATSDTDKIDLGEGDINQKEMSVKASRQPAVSPKSFITLWMCPDESCSVRQKMLRYFYY